MSHSRPKGVIAHVENYNWSDMKVYLLIDGLRMWRLATLSTLETRTLRIPPHLLQSAQAFQLQATAIGSGDTVTTPMINAVAGDEIVWTVQTHLANSINTMFIR